MKTIRLLLSSFACTLGVVSCNLPDPEPPVAFATQIRPILERTCVNCHNSGALFGDLNLENRAAAFKHRPAGPAIVPGAPDQSPLYLVLFRAEGQHAAMPPSGHRLPLRDADLIRRWISQGAPWPADRDGVVRPSVPMGPLGERPS